VQFIRTVAMISGNVILFVDRVTADAPHTFDLANHLAGTWKGVEGEPVSLPYRYVEDARKVHAIATDAAAITLADTEPTEILAATGPGKSTAERIPMSLFRRKGRETTYVWAISLDGAPVKLAIDGKTVRVGASTVTIDPAAHKVLIER
jgi:hypothetical protein